MNAPEQFVSKLRSAFDGRLRIRWSFSQREWHIEQRVGHGFATALGVIDEGDDELIRANDGYLFIMAVRNGDRMPCPKCDYEVRVPIRDTWDMRCPLCEIRGKKTRFVVGFWPLDDSLIEHLRKIDPLRDRQVDEVANADFRNNLLLDSQTNSALAPGNAQAEQDYRRLVGIPMTGYTGKEFRG